MLTYKSILRRVRLIERDYPYEEGDFDGWIRYSELEWYDLVDALDIPGIALQFHEDENGFKSGIEIRLPTGESVRMKDPSDDGPEEIAQDFYDFQRVYGPACRKLDQTYKKARQQFEAIVDRQRKKLADSAASAPAT